MLQNPTIQTCSPRLLFPLDAGNIRELFPGFSEGDFVVIHGSPSIRFLTSLLCVRAQLPPQLGGLGSSVIYVDGRNSFNLYQIARLARVHQLDPRRTLERIYISRAFTAYQMQTLLTEKIKEAAQRFGSKLLIISDIAATFLDKDLDDEEACAIYKHSIAHLADFAKENQLILIATYPPYYDTPRNNFLKTATYTASNVTISLKQTKCKRTFALEKHHTLPLGAIEFPPEQTALNDFITA